MEFLVRCTGYEEFSVFRFFSFHDWLWKNSYWKKTELFPFKNENTEFFPYQNENTEFFSNKNEKTQFFYYMIFIFRHTLSYQSLTEIRHSCMKFNSLII